MTDENEQDTATAPVSADDDSTGTRNGTDDPIAGDTATDGTDNGTDDPLAGQPTTGSDDGTTDEGSVVASDPLYGDQPEGTDGKAEQTPEAPHDGPLSVEESDGGTPQPDAGDDASTGNGGTEGVSDSDPGAGEDQAAGQSVPGELVESDTAGTGEGTQVAPGIQGDGTPTGPISTTADPTTGASEPVPAEGRIDWTAAGDTEEERTARAAAVYATAQQEGTTGQELTDLHTALGEVTAPTTGDGGTDSPAQ